MAFVWMPMVDGDSRPAAEDRMRELNDDRATHLWDPERHAGVAWARAMVAAHRDDLERALPPDQAIVLDGDPEDLPPAWDCVFFFRGDARWSSSPPLPHAWSKQLRFTEAADGIGSGVFWTGRVPAKLQSSTWKSEFDDGAARTTALKAPAGGTGRREK